jgi:hypothetical protein
MRASHGKSKWRQAIDNALNRGAFKLKKEIALLGCKWQGDKSVTICI